MTPRRPRDIETSTTRCSAPRNEQRAIFPLSGAHLWEISKIADPKQRAALADVLERMSGFEYLLGRTLIAQLEIEAAIGEQLCEAQAGRELQLIRPTFGQVFGFVGGLKIVDDAGVDVSARARSRVGGDQFESQMADMNAEFERQVLRGPSDDEATSLRERFGYKPEVAIAAHESRLAYELDLSARLAEHPQWRRGRLRDVVGAREFIHEWLDTLNRVLEERTESGRAPFNPTDDEMRKLLGGMAHGRVAVAIKTRFHRNAHHRWSTNTITDIDAVSVAHAYCDAVFTDKEIRAALAESKETRGYGTFLPRRAEDLTTWLDQRPSVVLPELLVPHPVSGV